MRTLAFLALTLVPFAALAQATDNVATHAQALAAPAKAPGPQTLVVNFELGGALTSGNTETKHLNMALNLDWAFAKDWLSSTTAHGLYEEATLPGPTADNKAPQDTALNWQLGERVDRYFSKELGLFASVAFERNPFAGLKLRQSAQLGVIFVLLEDKIPGEKPGDELVRDRLQLEAGGYLADEAHQTIPNVPNPPPPGAPETIIASRAAADYIHRFHKGSDTGATLEYIQDFKDTSNIVLQGGAYIAAAVIDGLSLKVAVTNRWDHQPAPGALKYDLLLTAGLLVNL